MKSRKICDGVDLRIIESPKFKTNRLSVFFHIPMKRETVTRAALLPSVLKRGCEKYPEYKQMTRHLADLYSAVCGGGIRQKGDGEVLYFTIDYVADAYIGENLTARAAEFLRELVFRPLVKDGGFLPEYLESEKTNLKNAILGLINDKKEYADVKCREAMFGTDGYGMFEAGYAEDLDAITPQNLYAFYDEVLQTAKVDIFVSGSVGEDCVDKICEILTPELNPRDASAVATVPAVSERSEIQQVCEEISVAQSKLSIGLCCGVDPSSDEYDALMLGGCIFGGSPFSKLFLNVREKLSLAYYASCRIDRIKSVMMISSGIETKNFRQAYDEIMVQLQAMKNGDITEEELAAAKKYLTNGLTAMNDSMRTLEDYYLSQGILGQNQSPEELIACLDKVGIAEIRAVMQKVTVDTVYFLKGAEETEA